MFGRFVRVRAHRGDPEATICVVAEPEVEKAMISCHLPTFECRLVPGMSAYRCAADEKFSLEAAMKGSMTILITRSRATRSRRGPSDIGR